LNLAIQNTDDGSKTIYSETYKETYHSVNGAVTESMHVFINAGFRFCSQNPIKILEIGFGTGLNALLTLREAKIKAVMVEYQSLELFPLEKSWIQKLDYSVELSTDLSIFSALHETPWGRNIEIIPGFQLYKMNADLVKFDFFDHYNLIYFDAFSPETQPELWTFDIFKKIFEHMKEGGILTTYCAKGIVRRTLQEVGFRTERLPGPPGKREMLRATK